jgi:hypothetical protein
LDSIAGFGFDFGALRNPDDELVQKYNWLVEPAPEKAAWFIANSKSLKSSEIGRTLSIDRPTQSSSRNG